MRIIYTFLVGVVICITAMCTVQCWIGPCTPNAVGGRSNLVTAYALHSSTAAAHPNWNALRASTVVAQRSNIAAESSHATTAPILVAAQESGVAHPAWQPPRHTQAAQTTTVGALHASSAAVAAHASTGIGLTSVTAPTSAQPSMDMLPVHAEALHAPTPTRVAQRVSLTGNTLHASTSPVAAQPSMTTANGFRASTASVAVKSNNKRAANASLAFPTRAAALTRTNTRTATPSRTSSKTTTTSSTSSKTATPSRTSTQTATPSRSSTRTSTSTTSPSPTPSPPPIPARILDAFVTDREYVLISTWLSPDDKSVGPPGWTEVGFNEPEPVRAFSFPKSTIDQRIAVPPAPPAHKYELAVATMFSETDDAAALTAFHTYYSLQGVDQFFLWYDGPLSLIASRLPKLSNTQWGEWNFQYHQFLQPNFTALGLYLHYAQPAFMAMFTKRFLPHCGHAMMLDVDEYLLPLAPNMTLRQYFANNTDTVVQAKSAWATLAAPGILRVNNKVIPWGREKCVYRGTFTGLMGIHRPKYREHELSVRGDLVLAHVVDVIHKERTEYVNRSDSALWRLGHGWCSKCNATM